MQTRPTGFPSSSGSGPATPVIETARVAGDRANIGLGVGNEAAVQALGRAGRLGKNGGELPRGTGFSGHDGRVALRGNFEGTLREAGQIDRIARRPTATRACGPLLG
jgi:hypothetical protein